MGVKERHREPEREASLTFFAYLRNIALLQNNQIRLSFVVTPQNMVILFKIVKIRKKIASSALRADSTLSPTLQ